MRKTPYWKFGGGYSYRTPRSKKTQWTKHLTDVPKTARSSATATTKKKSPASSPSKRRKTNVGKKKTRKRGGFKLPGGVGPKAVLFGALGLTVAPMILRGQSPGVQKLGTGLAMRALKIGGGGAISAVGLMELAAQFIGPMVGGAGLPFLGGGNGQTGFDY